jgi:hypothetical protein
VVLISFVGLYWKTPAADPVQKRVFTAHFFVLPLISMFFINLIVHFLRVAIFYQPHFPLDARQKELVKPFR